MSKGEGVRALMTAAPFAGRKPVFIGDDVTDESVFARLPQLGGIGFSVGRHFAGLAGIFDSPRDVRRALAAHGGKRAGCAGMTDFGLDLAVIGNGRTAALLEPSTRIVWWCLPRFDGDPVFCRLLAGDEEKGFSDVVLDGLVETHSEYHAQHRHRGDRARPTQTARPSASPISRRASGISAASCGRRS